MYDSSLLEPHPELRKSHSLRSLWELREKIGLEPVLNEINRRLESGEFDLKDLKEWQKIQKQSSKEKVSGNSSTPGEKTYTDWSPHSVFGPGEIKTEQTQKKPIKEDEKPSLFNTTPEENKPSLSPAVIAKLNKLVRMGMVDVSEVQYELTKEFGTYLELCQKEIHLLVKRVLELIKADEEIQIKIANDTREKAIKNYAAECFQKLWRIYIWKKCLPKAPIMKLRKAAISIQSVVRMFLAKRLMLILFEKRKEIIFLRKSIKALKIQTSWRRQRCRRASRLLVLQKKKRQLVATVTIQRFWKDIQYQKLKQNMSASIIQKLVKKRLHENKKRKLKNSASLIQNTWRNKMERNRSVKAITIQKFVRSKQVQSWYFKTRARFVSFQRISRKRKARKDLAATKIQRYFRSFRSKRKQSAWEKIVENTRKAVLLIQSTIRARNQRRKYTQVLLKIKRIQREWRKYIRSAKLTLLSSKATLIQCCWRFHHFKRMKHQKFSALKVQAIWREYKRKKEKLQQQKNLLALRQERLKLAIKEKNIAARSIQMTYRRYRKNTEKRRSRKTETIADVTEQINELVKTLKMENSGRLYGGRPASIGKSNIRRSPNKSRRSSKTQREIKKQVILPPVRTTPKHKNKQPRLQMKKNSPRDDTRVEVHIPKNNYKWSYRNQLKRMGPLPPSSQEQPEKRKDHIQRKVVSKPRIRTEPLGERKPWSNHYKNHNKRKLPNIYRRNHANKL